MYSERIGFNIVAITFAVILYKQLHNEIGRNLSKDYKHSCLGIKDIKVAFRPLVILLEVLTSSTTLNKSKNSI